MCWISKKKPERLVAKEDTTVYKIVQVFPDNKIHSYYNEFIYELGQIYNTECNVEYFKQDEDDLYLINEGFHSYNYNPSIGYDTIKQSVIVGSKSMEVYSGPGVFGMLCIIPKGTEYYINDYGDIVSTSIKPITLSTKELTNLTSGDNFEYNNTQYD